MVRKLGVGDGERVGGEGKAMEGLGVVSTERQKSL